MLLLRILLGNISVCGAQAWRLSECKRMSQFKNCELKNQQDVVTRNQAKKAQDFNAEKGKELKERFGRWRFKKRRCYNSRRVSPH